MPAVIKVCVCEPFESRTRSGREPFIHGIVLEAGASDLMHVYCNNVHSDVARDLLAIELQVKVIFAKAPKRCFLKQRKTLHVHISEEFITVVDHYLSTIHPNKA